MAKLREVQLGPIVGHVTDRTARIWIRAGDLEELGTKGDSHRRTLGVIAIRKAETERFSAEDVHYFRLKREYDRTGAFTFGADGSLGSDPQPSALLEESTRYVVRVGSLTVDDPGDDALSVDSSDLVSRLPQADVWIDDLNRLHRELSEATFKTGSASAAGDDDLAFLLGSCRYPNFGWSKRRADRIFGPMREEALGELGRPPSNFVLMVGDQIYADLLNRNVPIGRADTFKEFQERYRSAFKSPNMRRLLRSVPTYMILDDHEIEDNWSQDRINTDHGRHLFHIAISAYASYQWLHGPRNYGRHLFYSFVADGYPFFVLDTRTQRFMEDRLDHLEDNHLLGRPSLHEGEPSQLDLLLDWLSKQNRERGDVPKFIVSSSVFVPNPIHAREGRDGTPTQKVKWKEHSDSWPAFPTTRQAILRKIVESRIQNVVFLSGDIHCSNVAELRFEGPDNVDRLRSFSITSSALHWPFPFADGDPSGFVHDSKAKGQEDTFRVNEDVTMDYTAWNFTQEDNFCRIDVDRGKHCLSVIPLGDEGQVLRRGGMHGSPGAPLKSELSLAPW